ncbi:hypothetical protein CsatB_016591 [Cannabis sativa]
MAKDAPAFNPHLIVSQKFLERTYTYSERDATLYALGIGACARDAVDGDELKYVYHEDGQKFIQVLPTFAALFSNGSISFESLLPGLEYDPRLLLHGQQYIELYKPLPSSGRIMPVEAISNCWLGVSVLQIQNKVAVAGLHDKGKAAIVEIETKSYNESGELLCMNRLSGDYNPLHSDPALAKVAGFSQPILHGLCTLGFAVRAVIKRICKGDPNMVKSISGRFLLHVYPGETLITEMWLQGMRVIYQTKVKERNRAVLSGFVDLRNLTSSL